MSVKKATYNEASICWNNIEVYLWEVLLAIRKYACCSIATAESYAEPLIWYINTGRASCDFLHMLIKKRPYLIARRLLEGGSTDEAINRIKDFLGYNTEVA